MSDALGAPSVATGPAPAGRRGFVRAGAALAAATVVANLLGYAFAIVLSRALGPDAFGELAALLALGLIGSVPAIALQLLVARELASSATGAAVWVKTSLVIGGTLTGILWLLAPIATVYLGLSSPFPVMWIGVALLPTTVTGALQGILLGRQRYGGLAASYLLIAGLRFLGGCVAAATGASVSGAVAAATVGLVVACVLIARITASTGGESMSAAVIEGLGLRRRLRALVTAASTTAAVLVMTNLDVLLARHFLLPADSGHYGAGALFAKAAFWAPNFLAVLAFPLLARGESRRRSFLISASLTLAIGSVVVLGAALLAEPLIEATVGAAYTGVAGLAARFALLGVLTAIVQLLLYSGLARRTRTIEICVWAGIAAEALVVSVWFHADAAQIVNTSIVISATLCLVLAVAELRSPAGA